MTKEKYLEIIDSSPLDLDFPEVRAYLSGIYAVAVEDDEITSDDMLDIICAGDKVKVSVLGSEVD